MPCLTTFPFTVEGTVAMRIDFLIVLTRYSDCFRKIPPEKFLKRQLCFPVFRETDFHWRRIFPIRQFILTFEPNKFDMPGTSLSICFFFSKRLILFLFSV